MPEAEKTNSTQTSKADLGTMIAVIEDGLFPGGEKRERISVTIEREIASKDFYLASFISRQMKRVTPAIQREVELVGETAYVVYEVMQQIRAEERGEIGREVAQRKDTEKPLKVDSRAETAAIEGDVVDSLGKSRREIDKEINAAVRPEIPQLADYMQLQLEKAPSLETMRLVTETAVVVYQVEQLLRAKEKGEIG